MSDHMDREELSAQHGDSDANSTRLLISSSRKPVSYVNLAKRFLVEHGEVQLSALGVAISSMVTLAEILKNKRLAVEKRIVTSLEEISSDCRTRHKPKMSVTLVKSPQFDDILAAESAGKESRDGSSSNNTHRDYDGDPVNGMHVGPRQYVGGPGPGNRQGNDRSNPHGLRGGGHVGRGHPGSDNYAQDGYPFGARANIHPQQMRHDNRPNHLDRGRPQSDSQFRPDSSAGMFNPLGQRGMGTPDYSLHLSRLQQQQQLQHQMRQQQSYDSHPPLFGPMSDNASLTSCHPFGASAPSQYANFGQQPQSLQGGQQPGLGSFADSLQQQLQVQQLQQQLAAAQQFQQMEDTRQLDQLTQHSPGSPSMWLNNDTPHTTIQDPKGQQGGLQLNQEQLLMLQQAQGHQHWQKQARAQPQQPDAVTAQFENFGLDSLQLLPEGSKGDGKHGTDTRH